MDLNQGRVLAVNISKSKGEKKQNINQAYFKENWGIEIDAHSGLGHRQISLLSLSSVDKMKEMGVDVQFGDFAENITLDGIEVSNLPLGTKLKIGETILKVTQIGKACTNKGCAIRKQVGTCVMPTEGIFAQVINSGLVKVGDSIKVVN